MDKRRCCVVVVVNKEYKYLMNAALFTSTSSSVPLQSSADLRYVCLQSLPARLLRLISMSVSPQISPVRMITQMAMPDIDLEEGPPQSWPNRLRPNRVTRKPPRIGPEEVRLFGLNVHRDYTRSVRD